MKTVDKLMQTTDSELMKIFAGKLYTLVRINKYWKEQELDCDPATITTSTTQILVTPL